MNKRLNERLNQIGPRILSDEFLEGRGLGNELAFYIFDYPPEEELEVREHVRILVESLPKQRPGLRIAHLNLFGIIIDYLRERGLLDKATKLQRDKGDSAALKALKGPLHEEKVAQALVKAAQPDQHDVIFLSGIGTAWPLIRTHTLLNALHPLLTDTPLVVFYPGVYDGESVTLFGLITREGADGAGRGKPYYRAFQLVS